MNSPGSPNLIRNTAHALAALFSNSADFRRDWKRYSAVGSPPQGIEGCWLGEWISDVNGHHGQLEGVVTKSDSGKYQACFHATYSRFLRVYYEVDLKGREENGHVELEGEADLGQLAGGVYHYTGEATPTGFHCQYRCKYDHGPFRMKRLDATTNTLVPNRSNS